MVDRVPGTQHVAGPVENGVGVRVLLDHQVGGEYIHVGREGPDVQVVHVEHVLKSGEVGADIVGIHVLRSFLQQHTHGLPAEAQRPRHDPHADRESDPGIDDRLVGDQDQRTTRHDADRTNGVGQDLDAGALGSERLTSAQELQRDQVGGEPGRADDEHRQARHVRWIGDAMCGLPDGPDRHPDQQQGVGERREHLESVQAEGAFRAGRPAREGHCGQRQYEPAHIGQQVGSVSQQRERPGGDADRNLENEGDPGDDEREGEWALRLLTGPGHRSPVAVPVMVSVHRFHRRGRHASCVRYPAAVPLPGAPRRTPVAERQRLSGLLPRRVPRRHRPGRRAAQRTGCGRAPRLRQWGRRAHRSV